MMSYSMKPLGCDPQHVKGMSEKLIVSHYENNYGGAVKRLNLITEQLAGLDGKHVMMMGDTVVFGVHLPCVHRRAQMGWCVDQLLQTRLTEDEATEIMRADAKR